MCHPSSLCAVRRRAGGWTRRSRCFSRLDTVEVRPQCRARWVCSGWAQSRCIPSAGQGGCVPCVECSIRSSEKTLQLLSQALCCLCCFHGTLAGHYLWRESLNQWPASSRHNQSLFIEGKPSCVVCVGGERVMALCFQSPPGCGANTIPAQTDLRPVWRHQAEAVHGHCFPGHITDRGSG